MLAAGRTSAAAGIAAGAALFWTAALGVCALPIRPPATLRLVTGIMPLPIATASGTQGGPRRPSLTGVIRLLLLRGDAAKGLLAAGDEGITLAGASTVVGRAERVGRRASVSIFTVAVARADMLPSYRDGMGTSNRDLRGGGRVGLFTVDGRAIEVPDGMSRDFPRSRVLGDERLRAVVAEAGFSKTPPSSNSIDRPRHTAFNLTNFCK